jgi:hypothetical protein
MAQATESVIRLAQEAQMESLLLTKMPDKIKKPSWHKQLKVHDKAKRRSMTLMETLEREQQDEAEQPSEMPSKVPPKLPLDACDDDAVSVQQDDDGSDFVGVQDLAPPSSTAPPALGSKKRQRKHTTAYREAFGDSQDDPTAGIKRGKAEGLL